MPGSCDSVDRSKSSKSGARVDPGLAKADDDARAAETLALRRSVDATTEELERVRATSRLTAAVEETERAALEAEVAASNSSVDALQRQLDDVTAALVAERDARALDASLLEATTRDLEAVRESSRDLRESPSSPTSRTRASDARADETVAERERGVLLATPPPSPPSPPVLRRDRGLGTRHEDLRTIRTDLEAVKGAARAAFRVVEAIRARDAGQPQGRSVEDRRGLRDDASDSDDSDPELAFYRRQTALDDAARRAAKGCEILNFQGSYLSQFPLVSAHFWTSDHLSSSSRTVNAFSDRIDR